MIESIERRLDGAVEYVASVADLAIAMERHSNHRVAAYVVPVAERPQPVPPSASRKAAQQVDIMFGVVIRVSVRNDTDGMRGHSVLEQARNAIRDRLFAWTPEAATVGFQLGAGDLMKMEKGTLWWMDRYLTQCQRTANQSQ